MAYEFYVTIEGKKQGKFKGESPREVHKEKISGLSFHHFIQSPRDIATGQASGKRQHGPITITKEWGAATPQIFQAMVTNEALKSVLFEFIHTTPDGTEEVYHTIKLVDATISRVEYKTGAGALDAGAGSSKTTTAYDTHELEEVSFTYRRIELDNKTGKTAAADDWTQ